MHGDRQYDTLQGAHRAGEVPLTDEPYIRHVVEVDSEGEEYCFTCSCGLLLYLGSDERAGEKVEARHIREALALPPPPPSRRESPDWNHIITWFILGWFMSRDD